MEARESRSRILYLRPAGSSGNETRIADLPTRFRVKGRPVEKYLHWLPCLFRPSRGASTRHTASTLATPSSDS